MSGSTGPGRFSSPVGMASVALVGVVLVAVGVLGAVLWLPQSVPPSVLAASEAGSVAVSSEVYDGSRQMSASMVLGPAQVLRGQAGGVVTASSCVPEGVLSSGGVFLQVAGQPLIGLATSVPLWRDLGFGAKGADVSALQTELVRLGYSVRSTGAYDATTVAGVKAFFHAAGGGPTDGSLPLADVVWLPSPQVTVASCSVGVNDSVSPGGTLAQLAGGLLGVQVANPPGDGWAATYGNATAPIDSSGLVSDASFLAAVAAGPEFAAAMVPGGQNQLTLTVSLATPLNVLVVPSSSVIPSGAGAGCVVSDGQVVLVQIVASSLGKTMVSLTGGQTTPSTVEVRPASSVACS